MTGQDPDPATTAKWAAIDQLLAGFSKQLDGWVVAMQDQAAKHGPDQALANVMLALNLEPVPPADMKALLVIALQRLAAPPAEDMPDPNDDGYDPEDARYESPAGQLNQTIASAITVAQDLYRIAVNSGGKPVPGAHARLIAEMMGDPAQYEAIYQAIITGESDIGDGSLTQAARDALMPFACGECGAEVSVPGEEPDHFDWCTQARSRPADPDTEADPGDGADYTIDKP